jgi:hypothetical protein
MRRLITLLVLIAAPILIYLGVGTARVETEQKLAQQPART